MNNPVLLPKRREFGFLKGPKSSLTNINDLSTSVVAGSKNSAINTNRKNFFNEVKPINVTYEINKLKLKYELKTPYWLIDSKHGNQQYDAQSMAKRYIDKLAMNKTGSFSRTELLGMTSNKLAVDDKQQHPGKTTPGNVTNMRSNHQVLNVYSKYYTDTTSSSTNNSPNLTNTHTHTPNRLKLNELMVKGVNNGQKMYENNCLMCKFGPKSNHHAQGSAVTGSKSTVRPRRKANKLLGENLITMNSYKNPRATAKDELLDEDNFQRSILLSDYDNLFDHNRDSKLKKHNNTFVNPDNDTNLQLTINNANSNNTVRDNTRPKLTLWLV